MRHVLALAGLRDAEREFGAEALRHRLGRAFTGWTVVRIRGAQSTFIEATQDASLDAVQVTITPSATCTADVEVW